MDYIPHFRCEVLAFESAVRRATDADGAPLVPSCPGWSVSDLGAHLGAVHRYVIRIIKDRLVVQPESTDLTFLELPADREGWPTPEHAPNRGPVPVDLIDWFADGASTLESLFRTSGPGEPVRTWVARADHRVLAADTDHRGGRAPLGRRERDRGGPAGRGGARGKRRRQTFEVMAPARRAWRQAPPGSGERFRFRQTDGTGDWTVHFEGDDVRLNDSTGSCDVELAGTASDLMLFLWHRIPADQIDEVTGDRGVLDRYFTLVSPEPDAEAIAAALAVDDPGRPRR
ncbi:MAG: maleylpyruvate isomerase N-terminal domain-containing protein [Pseudonocardiaceae bacterium]